MLSARQARRRCSWQQVQTMRLSVVSSDAGCITNNYVQTPSATLAIQIAGASPGQFSVLNVQGNANLNGFIEPVLVNGFVPAIGQSFTFLDYASFTGFFHHIQNPVFDHGRKRWLLAYNPTSACPERDKERGVPPLGSDSSASCP